MYRDFLLVAYSVALLGLCRINGRHWFTRRRLPLSKEGASLCPRSSWTGCWLHMLTGPNIKLSNIVRIRLLYWRLLTLTLLEMEFKISSQYDIQRKKYVNTNRRCTNYSKLCSIFILSRFIAAFPNSERSAFVNDLME
jgi:hypothetical protein